MIPQEEHPDINFVGLLIGPRGNTLKSMEKETGAKIIIRGKGSVKEGKVGRKDGQPLPGEDEPLHAYITANNLDAVKKAVERIHEIIRQGVEVPEGQNDLRRNQLRELALLNGTLRENDGPRCTNCGASDHKSWLCPDKPNVTNNIVCSSCGGAGHIARDCRSKRPGQGGPTAAGIGGMSQAGDKAKIDEEYMSLMAELGEGPPPDRSKTGQARQNPNPNYPGLFDRQQPPRALMAAPAHPPPQMMQGGPMMPPPGMAPPPPWSQGGEGMNNMNMQWQPPVSMPPPPGVMQPPPPPPGSTTQPNIPPLMPWMAGNNQPPPPGQMPPTQIPPPGMGIPPWQQGQQGPMRPPPPGTAPPPGFPGGWQPQQMGGWPPAAPVPPPPQQQTPAPPGIDLNTLPTLLAQPPPPPPPTS